MPCLSRNDIEQIAAHVIDQYKRIFNIVRDTYRLLMERKGEEVSV